MYPILSPTPSSISLGGLSIQSLNLSASASSSTSSLGLPESNVEVVREEGLRHSSVQLEAR